MIRKRCAACAATFLLEAASGTKHFFEINSLIDGSETVTRETLLSKIRSLPDDLEGHCLIMGSQGQLCADAQLDLCKDRQALLGKVNWSTMKDLLLVIEQGSREQFR